MADKPYRIRTVSGEVFSWTGDVDDLLGRAVALRGAAEGAWLKLDSGTYVALQHVESFTPIG